MQTKTKSLIAAAGIAAVVGGSAVVAPRVSAPAQKAPEPWLKDPIVWVADEATVWMQTEDAGIVKAGNIVDVKANYPQFAEAIDKAVEEFKSRR